METLQNGKDKVLKICETLKERALEPALQEAKAKLIEAQEQAEQILLAAKQQAQNIIDEGRAEIEKEKQLIQSFLSQSVKQSIEEIKVRVEQKLFNEISQDTVRAEISSSDCIKNLINALISHVEREGLSQDMALVISKAHSSEEIANILTAEVLKKVANHPITVGSFSGGAQLKLKDKRLALAMTDEEVMDLLRRYVRKDFRKLIFSDSDGL